MELITNYNQELYRQTLGSFATGVAVATCQDTAGLPVGITINSFTSVSLQPPLILCCLSDRARATPAFLAAEHFAINILASGQEFISRHFSGQNAHDWSEIVQHHDSTTHPPLLAGCASWLVCRRHAQYPGGDHTILVGEVTALATDPAAALLGYYRKQYRHF